MVRVRVSGRASEWVREKGRESLHSESLLGFWDNIPAPQSSRPKTVLSAQKQQEDGYLGKVMSGISFSAEMRREIASVLSKDQLSSPPRWLCGVIMGLILSRPASTHHPKSPLRSHLAEVHEQEVEGVCLCVHACVCLCVCLWVYEYVCVCVYVCIWQTCMVWSGLYFENILATVCEESLVESNSGTRETN